MEPGIYLVHKRVGETSFEHVRRMTDEQRSGTGRVWPLCHGGTLDPFAEGLLLILVGPATKLMDLMHPIPKTYVAELAWGAETDNGDPTGKVIAEGDPSSLTPERLDAALRPFLGWTEQVPPATSAKKIGGEPAYKKVHRGEEVVLPPSRVYLHEAWFLSHELPRKSVIELTCRGGYYVRSLARDLGRALGCRAHLTTLRRTKIGPWRDPAERVWLHGREVMPWAASRVLTDFEVGELRQERAIPRSGTQPPEWPLPSGFPDPAAPIRAFHRDRLVALLQGDGELRAATWLRGGV